MTSTTTSSLSTIVTDVAAIIGAIAPILDVTMPAAGAAITVASKILVGVSAAEPEAVALYDQITSGTPPTEAQLAQYAAAYEAVDAQLSDDIANAESALPPS